MYRAQLICKLGETGLSLTEPQAFELTLKQALTTDKRLVEGK